MKVKVENVAADIESVEVLVIGAGPSGSLSSALLNKAGIKTLVLEKQKFPRFSIGESLLPQLMVFLESADMLNAVKAGGYQFKNGAVFRKDHRCSEFDFEKKFSAGPGTTFQVKRADFDMRLANEAERQGVPIRYEHEILNIDERTDYVLVDVRDKSGNQYQVKAGFVLDASGFGRVLPRLLKLETPSRFPLRKAIFCHLKDGITDLDYDRNKILICVHPEDSSVWYWMIPFSDGTSSFGVVGKSEFFDTLKGGNREKLLVCLHAEPNLNSLLGRSEIITDVRDIAGYAANVKSLFGERFALLGNAGEFLDPIFSSGVTIAFKSAVMASALLVRMSEGESVDWQREYSEPLLKGIDTFKAFVSAWYDGSFQDIIFYPGNNEEIRAKICSILAGYAWDENNPYTERAEQRLRVLAELCKSPG